MKIALITCYYSENPGTLLQALSLSDYLKSLGHEVVFINTRNRYSSHSLVKLIGRTIKEIIHWDPNNAKAVVQRYFAFQKVIQKLPIISLADCKIRNIDVLIIGSDTLWNVDAMYFLKSRNVFWPCMPDIRTISYGPSVANSCAESIQKYQNSLKCLNLLSACSVRDRYSRKVIEKLINKNIEVVCDPTILVGQVAMEKYRFFVKESPYILVYLDNDISNDAASAIRRYARKQNLQIVSLGKKFPWCDKNIYVSVKHFVSYFAEAKFVITNTFHGSVFSILYSRQFICLDDQKKKIEELLLEYDLSERRIPECRNFEYLFFKKIDFDPINKQMTTAREKSAIYLKNAIDGE